MSLTISKSANEINGNRIKTDSDTTRYNGEDGDNSAKPQTRAVQEVNLCNRG